MSDDDAPIRDPDDPQASAGAPASGDPPLDEDGAPAGGNGRVHEPASEDYLVEAEPVPEAPVAEEAEKSAVVFSARQIGRLREVLARLSGVRRSMLFYPPGHPAVREGVAGLMESISGFHDEGVDIPLTFFEGELLLGEQFLAEESMLFDQLVRDMSAIQANSVTFTRGLDADELARAMLVLSHDLASIEGMGGLEAAVAAAEAPHVLVHPVTVLEHVEHREEIGDREAARISYSNAIELLRELDRLIKMNRVASAERVRGVVRGLVDNVLSNRYALLELTGLKDYDEYTFFHSVNVAILALSLGSLISTDRRFLTSLGVGGLMHDIGKLTVDLSVLNKPGSLTSDEWALVRLHPVRGAQVAATMPGLDRSTVVVILEHHMRYDLDGYPERTPRRPQHVTSRIVAVADAYDAMTSRRSYSAARLQDEAIEVLAKNTGTAFDPALVRTFIQMMGIYPPRSVVRLSGGEMAIVLRASETDVLRPTVRVIADPTGRLVEPVDIDLADGIQAQGRQIESCVDPSALNVDVDEYML